MILLGVGLVGMGAPSPGRYGTEAGNMAAAPGATLGANLIYLVIPPTPSAQALPRTAGAMALRTALSQLGKPYRYGAAGPRSFDCSGLALFAYRAAGITLPHSSSAQFRAGPHIARNDLQPGDLIFWAGLGHVGIYVGGGQMVHAPRTGTAVSIISIDGDRFAGAVRPG